MQGFHQLLELFGCTGTLVMIAAAAGGHEIAFGMYIDLATAQVKFFAALRIVVVDLHALQLDGAAAISAMAVELLIDAFADFL